MSRPLLVIVSGPPGAGKTTIARRLGPALGLPVIAKDDIKESLFDSLGWSDRAWSRKVGEATWNLLFLLLERFMEGRSSVVVESNFERTRHRDPLDQLRRRYGFDVVEVYCTAEPATLARRFRERESSKVRHPGHHGFGSVPNDEGFVEELTRRNHVPMDIGRVTIEVDTSDPERVDFNGVVSRVRIALGEADGSQDRRRAADDDPRRAQAARPRPTGAP